MVGGGARSTAVVGLQWGDEGKGKLVDRLAGEHDATVRFNGGANAGHSVVVGGVRYALHLMPSGVLSERALGVIGNGVVIDPQALIAEIDGLSAKGVDTSRLVISDRAHVVLPYHKIEDELREALLSGKALGTTKRGIGPAYADKVQRGAAVRMGDLTRPEVLREKVEQACRLKNGLIREMAQRVGQEAADLDADAITDQALAWGQRLAPMIDDTVYLLNAMIREGKRVLFEGANATLLDVDHGTYPFVTSSNSSALGICAGAGVPPSAVGRVIGVMKAYSTRVGAGPMPTELHDSTADLIRDKGNEYGTTTGRPRRVGWLDLVAVRYSAMVNGVDDIALTLLDVLSGFDELRLCVAYETPEGRTERFIPDAPRLTQASPVYETLAGFSQDLTGCRSLDELPGQARAYVERIESFIGVPVRSIGVGPDREQTIEISRGVCV